MIVWVGRDPPAIPEWRGSWANDRFDIIRRDSSQVDDGGWNDVTATVKEALVAMAPHLEPHLLDIATSKA